MLCTLNTLLLRPHDKKAHLIKDYISYTAAPFPPGWTEQEDLETLRNSHQDLALQSIFPEVLGENPLDHPALRQVNLPLTEPKAETISAFGLYFHLAQTVACTWLTRALVGAT